MNPLHWIARSSEIRTLRAVLAPAESGALLFTTPLVYVCGPHSTGKSTVVRALVDGLNVDNAGTVTVDCREVLSRRILFERIINGISASLRSTKPGDDADGKPLHITCSGLPVDFVEKLAPLVTVAVPCYIVLDHSEHLLDNPELLSIFFTLQSILSRNNVTVIMISHLQWDAFDVDPGLFDLPLHVYFDPYTDEQLSDIIAMDFPDGGDAELYKILGSYLVTTFRQTKDLNELRFIAAHLYPKFIEPITSGTVMRHETGKLLRQLEKYWEDAHRLYLRQITESEWNELSRQNRVPSMFLRQTNCPPRTPSRHSNTANGSPSHSAQTSTPLQTLLTSPHTPTNTSFQTQNPPSKRIDNTISLPKLSKFLLVAAYLASYNPQKDDHRIFARGGGGVAGGGRKRKGGITAPRSSATTQHPSTKKSTSSTRKIRPQLIGPKSFTIDRLIALFYGVIRSVDEDVQLDYNVDLQAQVMGLLTLRLLSRAGVSDHLDSIKFRCSFSYEFVKRVAEEVGCNLHELLHDAS
ncbi:origin recognition complex subunit 5 C-terminus-domain-containing protein [Cladochytrium replicatum]|nr:origin recognition complex subunit 5 C-terminus-domain-containing protein [Cladochytrium replicatum]